MPCSADGRQDLLFDAGGSGGGASFSGHFRRRSHKAGTIPEGFTNDR
jgi:hypothetical protein